MTLLYDILRARYDDFNGEAHPMIEFALVLFAIYTLLPIVITGALILLAIWIAIRLIAIAAGWFLLYLIIVVLLSIFSKCNTNKRYYYRWSKS